MIYAFLGVAFLVVVFLTGAFLAGLALTAGWGALDFVTRPDLVLPRTTGALSSTAGACDRVRWKSSS